MGETRIIVAGGREYNDFSELCSELDFIISHNCTKDEKITIVSGAAKGTDKMGEAYAKSRSLNLKVIPAQWFKFGRSAGPKRNAEMAEYATADGSRAMLVAFWNGKSRGTGNMINIAKEKGIEIHIVECHYEKEENK